MLAVVSLALLAATGAAAQGLNVVGSSAAKDLMEGAISNYGQPVTYEAEGSGAGQDYVTSGSGPLGVGDVPFSDNPDNVLQLPIAVGAIAMYANLGSGSLESLTAEQICGIFSGSTQTWDEVDPSLESIPVMPVVRSDSSGSTEVFTSWLSNACGSWGVGSGTDVDFPASFMAVDGTSEMISAIAGEAGTIGYASCGREEGGATEIAVVNKAGNAVKCTEADYAALNVSPPGEGASGDWSSVSAVNTDAAQSYPMSFILYLYLASDLSSFENGEAAKEFASYLLQDSTQGSFGNYNFNAVPSSLKEASMAGVNAA